MAANPTYDSEGEIPVAARGTGIQTIDGFMTRTPFESQVDLQASYVDQDGRQQTADVHGRHLQPVQQDAQSLGYDQNTQLNAGTPNPDFGKPVNSLLSRHAAAVPGAVQHATRRPVRVLDVRTSPRKMGATSVAPFFIGRR